MPTPVVFQSRTDVNPVGSEMEFTSARFTELYGLAFSTPGMRAWLQFKEDAARADGWIVTVGADLVEVSKTVFEIGDVPVVKTRRFFLR